MRCSAGCWKAWTMRWFAKSRRRCSRRATPPPCWPRRSRVSTGACRSGTSKPGCGPDPSRTRSPRKPIACWRRDSPSGTSPRPQSARANLLAEGLPDESIYVTGNTVIDALLEVAPRAEGPDLSFASGKRLILMTAHRRENFGAPMEAVFCGGQAPRGAPQRCRRALSGAPESQRQGDGPSTVVGTSEHPPARPARLRTVRRRDEGVPLRAHRLGRRTGGGPGARQAGARHARGDGASGSRGVRSREARRHAVGGDPLSTANNCSTARRFTNRWRKVCRRTATERLPRASSGFSSLR